jgi:hypothetical protein
MDASPALLSHRTERYEPRSRITITLARPGKRFFSLNPEVVPLLLCGDYELTSGRRRAN